jgi:hypothetical protein
MRTDAVQQIRIFRRQLGWSTETEDIFAATDLSLTHSRLQDVLDFIASLPEQARVELAVRRCWYS